VCSHTCYTTTGTGGGASAIASAACLPADNGCTPAAAWVERIDLCPCGSGFPILFVKPYEPTHAMVAFVGESFPPGAWRLDVNDSTCEPSGISACPVSATGDCNANAGVWTWPGISINPGVYNSFELHLDDGSANPCLNNAFWEFALIPET
jgi:hypothetical protein